MKQRAFLEILVDKNNLEGAWVFEQVLLVLHKVYDKWNKKSHNDSFSDTFSFEITKIGNRIRFFITCESKYKDFLINQIYAHYNNVEIHEVKDYFSAIPKDKIQVGELTLQKHYIYPINTFWELQDATIKTQIDPYASITSSLSKIGKYSLNTLQINFIPLAENERKKNINHTMEVLSSHRSNFYKKLHLNKNFKFLKLGLIPFYGIAIFIKLIFWKWISSGETSKDKEEIEIKPSFLSKISHPGYKVSINIIHAGEKPMEGRMAIKEIFSTLSIYTNFWNNSFRLTGITNEETKVRNVIKRRGDEKMILNSSELAWLVHLPTSYVKTHSINWISSKAFEPPTSLPIIDPDLKDNTNPQSFLTPLGKTNFRGTDMSFWIAHDDRRRHIYIIGKTWMGKSTLLENMIIDDMNKGRWLALVDPHGDLAEAVIGLIPKNRTNHTIIFDPSDKEWPIAFNMLEDIDPELRPLVASGLVGIFKKIFWTSWGPRLEHVLRNTILALLEYPNSTLISIPLMLTSDDFRRRVVGKITDPVVKNFWKWEFAKLSPQQRIETINPILNKVGQLLSSPILRNILGQTKNSFNLRWAMDNGKIIIVNLSKWKIGEDASSLLWAMLITKFQLEAMSRADIKEKERKDFYLYVDEFQNFATDSFAVILSEARKYKLNLVMANQYIDQMTESLKGAIFWNVWSLLAFQVGYNDARILKEAFAWWIEEEDLVNIKKYSIYLKMLIDGVPSPIFSADTFAPHKKDDDEFKERYEKILQVSREKYCKPRKLVVEKINKMLEGVEEREEKIEKENKREK
jgi:hypothetical protein